MFFCLFLSFSHIKEHLKEEYGFNDEQAEKYLKVTAMCIYILEIAIATQMPPHLLWDYKLGSVVHEFIVGKLVFMAMNIQPL